MTSLSNSTFLNRFRFIFSVSDSVEDIGEIWKDSIIPRFRGLLDYCIVDNKRATRGDGDEIAFDVLNSGIDKCQISITVFAC